MYLSPLYLLTPFSLIYFLSWQQQASILFSQVQITYISAAQPTLIPVSHKCFKYKLVRVAFILLPPKYCSPWRFLLPHKSNWNPDRFFDFSLSFVFCLTGTLPPPLTITLLCPFLTVLQQSSSSHMGGSTSPPTHLCALCIHSLTGHLSQRLMVLKALTKNKVQTPQPWKSGFLTNIIGFPTYLIHITCVARKRNTCPTHALRALTTFARLCSLPAMLWSTSNPTSAPSTHL